MDKVSLVQVERLRKFLKRERRPHRLSKTFCFVLSRNILDKYARDSKQKNTKLAQIGQDLQDNTFVSMKKFQFTRRSLIVSTRVAATVAIFLNLASGDIR